MKYFAKISCGIGMTTYAVLEEVDLESAEIRARNLCIDLADDYGYHQDEEYLDTLDQVVREDSWCEESEEYLDVEELEYTVDIYNPEQHDNYLR
ncbi:hypothetical protein KUA24_122 [Vibrio phage HNL01]|nr:hypothetical protein KUA24_122 [Vibrio phage HNL01]